MMGDFYSSFAKEGWQHLPLLIEELGSSATRPLKEMQKILDAVRKEAADVKDVRDGKKDKFEATDSGVFEGITKNRRNEDGQYSFLELAQRNKLTSQRGTRAAPTAHMCIRYLSKMALKPPSGVTKTRLAR